MTAAPVRKTLETSRHHYSDLRLCTVATHCIPHFFPDFEGGYTKYSQLHAQYRLLQITAWVLQPTMSFDINPHFPTLVPVLHKLCSLT